MPVAVNTRVVAITAKPQAAILTATAKNTAAPYAWRRLIETQFSASDYKVNTKKNTGAATGTYYPNESYTLSHDARKSVNIDLNSDDLARLLYWACGSISSSQPASGTDPNVWQHVIKPLDLAATLQLPTFGYAEKASGGLDQEFVGQCLSKLALSGNGVDRIVGAFDWIGTGKRTTPSGLILQPTASYNVPAPSGLIYFTNSQVSLTTSDSVSLANPIDYCAGKRLNSWSIEVQNSFNEEGAYRPCAGDFQTTGDNTSGAVRSELLLTNQTIAPQIVVRVEAGSQEQAYLQSQRLLDFKLSLIGPTISNAYKHRLDFQVAIATYEAVQVGETDGLLTFAINVAALADLATGNVFSFTITNNKNGNTYV